MTNLNDSILHLQKMIEGEKKKSVEFAKLAKKDNDMEDYNLYHGEERAFNYTLNHLKKIIEFYQLKGCKTTARKTTTKRK